MPLSVAPLSTVVALINGGALNGTARAFAFASGMAAEDCLLRVACPAR